MPRESDLSIKLTEIQDAISDYLGYGPVFAETDASEQLAVKTVIKRGERRAYHPPGVNGKPPHQWSFLRPLFSFDTVEDQWEYTLPPEYGGIEGDITFADNTTNYPCIQSLVEQKIREMRGVNDTSGQPRYYAIIALAHDRRIGQRYNLQLYPTPDAAYSLQFRMLINSQSMTQAFPYPYGGQKFSEVILASCLAVAENFRHGGGDGSKQADFMVQLEAAVKLDQDVHEPDTYGINRDGGLTRKNRDRTVGVDVTFNGVLY